MHVIISTNITDTVTIYNFFNLYIYFLQHKTDSALVSAAMRRFNFTSDSSSVSTNAAYTSIYDTKTSPH